MPARDRTSRRPPGTLERPSRPRPSSRSTSSPAVERRPDVGRPPGAAGRGRLARHRLAGARAALAACSRPSCRSTTPTRTPSIVGQGPGTDGHILGGDGLGRDMLSRRMVWGRATLLIGVASIVLGLVVGGLLGLVAGYFRGRTDTVLTGVFDVLLSFPQLILALTLVTVFASGEGISRTRRMVVLILALGVVSIPVLGRITRANTLAWSQREFVLAAPRPWGRATVRSCSRGAAQRAARDVLDRPARRGGGDRGRGRPQRAGGRGAAPTPSWGNIIAEGRSDLRDSPHIVLIPRS